MLGRVSLEQGNNEELARRIIIRFEDQGVEEVNHSLSVLFPESPAMRIRSMAEELAAGRAYSDKEFLEMVKNEQIEMDIFNVLSSAEKAGQLIAQRGNFKPTKFVVTLTCARTPFKEVFDECKNITCESCIEGRMTNFSTENQFSTAPWSVKLDKVEQRRIDLCKNCGSILGKGSEINMQNERLLYTCSYCGHKGWTRAK